jgi:hypothetical protein
LVWNGAAHISKTTKEGNPYVLKFVSNGMRSLKRSRASL